MPLTALNSNGEVLDSTELDATAWATLHKVRPPALLTCRQCHSRMGARVSSKGMRFFYHLSPPAGCPSSGESAEHLTLKKVVASIIRSLGAKAELEAAPGDSDVGGWRADVLATTPTGRRVAFEIQLASMTVETGEERSNKYKLDGIETVWVSSKRPHWMCRIPSLQVEESKPGVYSVVSGLGSLGGRFSSPRWEPSEELPLRSVVWKILKGDTVTEEIDHLTLHVRERSYWLTPAVLIVPRSEKLEKEAREYELRKLDDVISGVRRATPEHQKHTQLLHERQARVLQYAVPEIAAEKPRTEYVWLGKNQVMWDYKKPVSGSSAMGDEATAQGGVVLVGKSRTDLRVFAIICPVVSKLSKRLGTLWKTNEIRIYVETHEECIKISKALGWSTSEVRVVSGIDALLPGPARQETLF